MTKFWIGAGTVFLIGLLAVFSATGNSTVTVNDLETECRGDRTTTTDISLENDNSLHFQGHFPVKNTNSNMNFNYKNGKNIVLNVKSQNKPAAEFLWYDCLASGVYDIQTQSLDQGTYSVEVKHDGERAEKRVIRVK